MSDIWRRLLLAHSLARLPSEPSGWWRAAVLDSLDPTGVSTGQRQETATPTNEGDEDAREVYERSVRFAEVGVTHVVHLLGGDGLPMAWREFKDRAPA